MGGVTEKVKQGKRQGEWEDQSAAALSWGSVKTWLRRPLNTDPEEVMGTDGFGSRANTLADRLGVDSERKNRVFLCSAR